MIKVYFFNLSGQALNMEQELKIDLETADFLTRQVPGLTYDRMDHNGGRASNVTYFFSSGDEQASCAAIISLLNERLTGSQTRFTVTYFHPGEITGMNGRGAIFICSKCGRRFAKMDRSCPWCKTVQFDK